MSDTAVKRDEKGRLLPGHGLKSPGRPKRVHELRYLSIMHRMLTPETWAAITEKAIQQAVEGDATARAWLSKYHLPEKIDQFAELDGD